MLKKSYRRKKSLIAYSFILPNFIGYFILTFIPIILTFVMSLCEWNFGQTVNFVGFKNFIQMFTKDSQFSLVLINTIYYTVVTVPVTMVFSLLLAMLMNSNLKGRVFFRSVLFFPYVASLVAIAIVWMALFSPQSGPVNSVLRSIGIANPPRWAADKHWAMPTIIGLTVWKGVGYYMIVYLAALQGVPGELYEAARIDGASRFQQFTNITWPTVTPTTFFVVMMLTISTFKSYDIMYITTQGGPGTATKVLAYHIYNKAFKDNAFGYASALSIVLFLIVLAFTLLQFKVEKKFTNDL
ncbi:carbohydrate ABC transporter permease [Lacrimispora sp.]|uniref:carbohydrate ABC transporter permease n=1 Tax=Lacrimispora sp. TaxID=2719234 RepID=UPI00289A8451|nr:sugar ABC transporter permease [Lacrimispora sp.]